MAHPRPPRILSIYIEIDRRETLRIDIDASSLKLAGPGVTAGQVVAFEGEEAETGMLVSGATPLGAVLAGPVRQALQEGNFTALRLRCGTGQVLPIRRAETAGGEISALEVLRAGEVVDLDHASLLDLMMPDQHRHLARAAARRAA